MAELRPRIRSAQSANLNRVCGHTRAPTYPDSICSGILNTDFRPRILLGRLGGLNHYLYSTLVPRTINVAKRYTFWDCVLRRKEPAGGPADRDQNQEMESY
jgi:hypothetical protein